MNRRTRKWLLIVGALSVTHFGWGAAGESPASAAPPATNPPVSVPLPLLLPRGGKSPVETFRELLDMSPAERKQFLSNRSPETQKQILAKVREYESMKPSVRKLRLQVTELRWYLLPLMGTAPAERAALLSRVPPDLLPLIETRLRDWDKLPPETQKELLDNEATLRYFTELELGTGSSSISPARKQMLERGIAQWQSMPETQREKITERFKRFFELTSQEQEKALGTLSEAERQQIEKTLTAYSKLNAVQRAVCLRSFVKFASLPLEERQQFLKNAERWKLMTPEERQAWKDLVNKLTPTAAQPSERATLAEGTRPPPRPPPLRLPVRSAPTNHN